MTSINPNNTTSTCNLSNELKYVCCMDNCHKLTEKLISFLELKLNDLDWVDNVSKNEILQEMRVFAKGEILKIPHGLDKKEQVIQSMFLFSKFRKQFIKH
jgi:hypothetical protein